MIISSMSASSVYNYEYDKRTGNMYHRILLIWAPYRPQRVEVIILILLFRYRFNLVFYERYQLYRLVQKVLSYVVSIRISKVNQIRLSIMVSKVFRLPSHSKTYYEIVHDDLKSLDKFIQAITVRTDYFFRIMFLITFCKYITHIYNTLAENFLSTLQN